MPRTLALQPCHLSEDQHGNAFPTVKYPSYTHQLLVDVIQLQVWQTVCINHSYVFVLPPKEKMINWLWNSLRKTKRVSFESSVCFLSNFCQNSKNQVKKVHPSKTADPSGYRHQDQCFGRVFTVLQRDKDKGDTQFAFSSTLLITQRTHSFLYYKILKQIWI